MIKRICGLLLVFMLVSSMFIGCGSSKTESSQNSASMSIAKAEEKKADYAGEGTQMAAKPAEKPKAEAGKAADSGSITEAGSAARTVANAILAQRKVIRNANVSIEVDDFDVAYGKIKSMIEAFGFVQETNIKKEKILVEGKEKLLTKGIIIIRVDKDKFDSTMDGINGLGIVTDHSIKTDDVTDKYFDTESRLRLLKYEEARLEEYLHKLTDPDTIFKTESRLTDIRYEIEGLTGTLRKWNDLVQLSTITINMSEKYPAAMMPIPKNNSYWSRLAGGFTGSTKGVLGFLGEAVIFAAQAIPVLIFLTLVAVAAWALYKRVIKNAGKNRAKHEEKDTDI